MAKVLLLLITISLYAVSETETNYNFPIDKIRNEEPMFYIKNSKTVGVFLNEKEIIMNSIGYLQYSEDFFYGLEYSSYFGKNESNRVKNLQVISGYRVLWNKKFLPYIQLQFGTSSFKNENNEELDRGDGISTTIDIGLDVFKIWKVKSSFGIRKMETSFSNANKSNFSFTDLYLMIGFVF